jgi:hypothetical protein
MNIPIPIIMAGIIWFTSDGQCTWVAENWLFESFLSDAQAHFKGDEQALKVLKKAKRTHDLELRLLEESDAALAKRLREGLRATACETLERGTDAKGGTKKYLDKTGQEYFLDKIRGYLSRTGDAEAL